jgi:hypothetical protein
MTLSLMKQGRCFPASPLRLMPIRHGSCIWIHGQEGGYAQVTESGAALLRHLEDPLNAPLEENPTQETLEAFQRWRKAGWIRHEQDLPPAAANGPHPPALLCIPTAGRPETLVRTVCSFAENFHRHGHSLPILISEDTRDPARSQSYRSLLDQAPLAGQTVKLLDRPAKKREIERLARKGFDPEVLSFLWLAPTEHPYDAQGAGCNFLMYAVAGKFYLGVDDDILCRAVRPEALPEAKNRQAFFYKRLPGLQEALEFRPTHEPDFADSCLQWLGRDSRAVFPEAAPPRAKLLQCHASFWRRLCDRESKVRMINHGIVGDMGVDNPVQFLNLDPRNGQALAGSDEEVSRLLTCRHGLSLAMGPQLTDSGLMQSHSFGLDLRALFPPFIPWFRNLDTLFSRMFYSMNTADFSMRLPLAMAHQPGTNRAPLPDPRKNARAAHQLIRISTLLIDLADPAPASAAALDPAASLGWIGARLQSLAALGPADFVQAIDEKCRELLAANCQILSIPSPFASIPAWASAREGLLQQCLKLLEQPEVLAPYEIEHGKSPDWEGLRFFLRHYGKSLEVWPALMQEALKRDGEEEF